MNHILVIVPESAFYELPEDQQTSLVELIRHYLVDKTCNPMNGALMMRGSERVIVGAHWREHCSADLTAEAIATINAKLSNIGVLVVECADIPAKLSEMGINAVTSDGVTP